MGVFTLQLPKAVIQRGLPLRSIEVLSLAQQVFAMSGESTDIIIQVSIRAVSITGEALPP